MMNETVLDAYVAREGETPNAATTPDGTLTHYVDLDAPEDGAWVYDTTPAYYWRIPIRLYTGDLLWVDRSEVDAR